MNADTHVCLPTVCLTHKHSLFWLLWGWVNNCAIFFFRLQTISLQHAGGGNSSKVCFKRRGSWYCHAAMWPVCGRHFHAANTVTEEEHLQHGTAWLPSFLSIKFPWQWNARAGEGRRRDKCYLPYSASFQLGNYIQPETFLLPLPHSSSLSVSSRLV